MSGGPATILITGSSTGIGRATALIAHSRGHHVIASARRIDALKGLPSPIQRLQLDVTDPTSIDRALLELPAAVDTLVNNAGVSIVGPHELTTDSEMVEMFRTNVLGPAILIQRLLPRLRKADRATIVNVTSAVGLVAVPYLAGYSASKAALESLSDAMRLELAPHGVRVVVVEPGPIRRDGRPSRREPLERALALPSGGYHGPALRIAHQRTAGSVLERGPEAVARTIVRAVEASRPRTRYRVTLPAKPLPVIRALPGPIRDWLVASVLDSQPSAGSRRRFRRHEADSTGFSSTCNTVDLDGDSGLDEASCHERADNPADQRGQR